MSINGVRTICRLRQTTLGLEPRLGLRRYSQRHRQPRFRILFCGSDEFSVRNLEALLAATDVYQSVHVLTPRKRRTPIRSSVQPAVSAKCMRANDKLMKVALLDYASSKGLPTSQVPPHGIDRYNPPKLFDRDTPGNENVLVTASFGHIIPNSFLARFEPNKRLNVHPSLLPTYRGAAPIQWTIANGDTRTGVSVQRLVERGRGIDGGDIVGAIDDIEVPPGSTYRTLLDKVSPVGGDLLVDVLRKIQCGEDKGVPQDPTRVTRAPKIIRDTARVDWSKQDANQIDALARGIAHQYPLWTTLDGATVQLISPAPVDAPLIGEGSAQPGTALLQRDTGRLFFACANDEWVRVKRIKSEGKKEMNVSDWWNGLPKAVRKAKTIQFK